LQLYCLQQSSNAADQFHAKLHGVKGANVQAKNTKASIKVPNATNPIKIKMKYRILQSDAIMKQVSVNPPPSPLHHPCLAEHSAQLGTPANMEQFN